MGMGGVQRPTYLARHLSMLGWNVSVLTVRPVAYAANDNSLSAVLPGGVSVHRVSALAPKTLVKSYLKRSDPNTTAATAGIRSWLMIPDNKVISSINMTLAAGALADRINPGVVITTSPPPSVHLTGLFLQRFYGIKWVADFRDLWLPGNVLDFTSGFHEMIYDTLRGSILKLADSIVVVSEGFLDKLSRHSGKNSDIQAISNGYEDEDYANLHESCGDRDRKLITYCGTLNELTYPTGLAEAIVEASKTVPLKLKVYGVSSPSVTRMIKKADPNGDTIQFMGYAEHKDVSRIRCSADANLITLVDGTRMMDTVPGKIYECLRSPAHVIGVVPRDGASWRLLNRFERVSLIDANDIVGAHSAFGDVLDSLKESAAGRSGIEMYSWKSVARKYDTLLRRLIE
jgi:glycosyltransferase involved in cell wall biosynthesis